jgi:hypothetical protein
MTTHDRGVRKAEQLRFVEGRLIDHPLCVAPDGDMSTMSPTIPPASMVRSRTRRSSARPWASCRAEPLPRVQRPTRGQQVARRRVPYARLLKGDDSLAADIMADVSAARAPFAIR